MTTPAPYRAGILAIARTYGRKRMERMLPPETRIAAIKSGLAFDDYLLEGATLPIVPAGAQPEYVSIYPSAQYVPHPETGSVEVRIDVAWRHAPDKSWTIGSWPTFEAWSAEMDSLDA